MHGLYPRVYSGQRACHSWLCMVAQIWNPSFDVTPAHLIAGIITEHGLVPRAGTEHGLVPRAGKTFSVMAFAHSRVSS